MATLRPVALVASLAFASSCYRQEPDYYSTLPEPIEVAGPPSGDIDPAWQASYVDDSSSGALTGSVEMSADAQDPNAVMAACTNGEIDATLSPYGEWIYVEGYGEVWRPYTTAVGVDFTPYETCGSWVWTDYGWTFACEWDWGWLPFHYGRWGWFDDYWAWQPGYDWSPAWVEWRGGGGYVGWRPQGPIVRDHRSSTVADTTGFGAGARDHRGEHAGPLVRDHRTSSRRTPKIKDWQWRFAAANDFGKPRIRAHLFKSPAEGLRVTSLATRPQVRATVQPVKAESIMRARLAATAKIGVRDGGSFSTIGGSRDQRVQPGRMQPGVTDPRPRPARPSAGASDSITAPIYVPPRRPARFDRNAAVPTPRDPSEGPNRELGGLPVQPTTPTPSPDDHPRTPVATPTSPPTSVAPPTSHPPRAPTYTPPSRPSYSPPSQPTYTPPTYTPTPPRAPTYTPPSRPSYSPPSQPTYTPPSRPSYSPPSQPSRPSYSPPPSAPSGGSRSHRR